jgi:hypothetical protein
MIKVRRRRFTYSSLPREAPTLSERRGLRPRTGCFHWSFLRFPLLMDQSHASSLSAIWGRTALKPPTLLRSLPWSTPDVTLFLRLQSKSVHGRIRATRVGDSASSILRMQFLPLLEVSWNHRRRRRRRWFQCQLQLWPRRQFKPQLSLLQHLHPK